MQAIHGGRRWPRPLLVHVRERRLHRDRACKLSVLAAAVWDDARARDADDRADARGAARERRRIARGARRVRVQPARLRPPGPPR